MPSRRPPSQRDPKYAPHRLGTTVNQILTGAKVRNASPVRAVSALRSVTTGGTTIPDGTTAGDAYIWDGAAWNPGRICTVATTAPASPYTGQFFYDTDATC